MTQQQTAATDKLRVGSDPRKLPDFIAVRDEISKLTHPARPDVNWQRVEQHCLSLFRQNGVELQTACWYTQARTQLAGLSGLNDGLAWLNALLTRYWVEMWPQQERARMSILLNLSQRVLSILRRLTFEHDDLAIIYQAEAYLKDIRDVLKQAQNDVSQIDGLCTFMRQAAVRLENTGDSLPPPPIVVPEPAVTLTPAARPTKRPRSQSQAAIVPPAPPVRVSQWKGFIAGVVTALVITAAAVWGWSQLYPQKNPLPLVANQQSMTALTTFSPLWLQEYGFTLAAQAQPAESERLRSEWQAYIVANALPEANLSAWHQGMNALQKLTLRLNSLNDRKGEYMTVSELKSGLFNITQSLQHAAPLEEQLYQLSLSKAAAPLPAAQVLEIEMHIQQLLNRFMLIRQGEK